jgi:hypothetical protein
LFSYQSLFKLFVALIFYRYYIIQLLIIAGIKYNDYQIKFMPAIAYIYELAVIVIDTLQNDNSPKF